MRPTRTGRAVSCVLGLHVAGAVLEAEQVARRGLRVGGRRRAPEAELRPAHRRWCRTRCGPGCGSRAPPPAGRRRTPARTGRRPSAPGRGCRRRSAAASASAAGRRAASPKRSLPSFLEQAGPEAERDGQPSRRQPEGLAGVLRRGDVRAVDGAELADVAALGHLGRGVGPRLQQRDEVVARLGGHVEGGEVQAVLRGGDDARLVVAVELDARRRARRARRRCCSPRERRPVTATARAGGTHARHVQEAAARQAHSDDRRGQLGEGFAERVDRVGELLDLVGGELGVEHEAVAVPVLVEQCLQRRRTVRSAWWRAPGPSSPRRLQVLERDASAVDVGLEVPQVGVRPDLLFAGHLAGRHLVEQLLGAVAELGRRRRSGPARESDRSCVSATSWSASAVRSSAVSAV